MRMLCVTVYVSTSSFAELSWARTIDSATYFHTGARRCPNRVKWRDVDIVQAFLPCSETTAQTTV